MKQEPLSWTSQEASLVSPLSVLDEGMDIRAGGKNETEAMEAGRREEGGERELEAQEGQVKA